MANAYRSFAEQALHYFIRDHEKTPSPPINSPANWMGSGIQERETEWLELLSKDDLIEISDAVDQAHAQNIGMEALSRETFALPRLSKRIASWRDEIKSGRGFVVVRGFPLEEWGEEKAAYAYWGLGHHLGAPGAQNPQGELLGHVVDGSGQGVQLAQLGGLHPGGVLPRADALGHGRHSANGAGHPTRQ